MTEDPGPPTWSAAAAPPPPDGAAAVCGEQLPVVEAFAAVLADTGITHGLIGPREVPRLWDRHLLNCAVVHPAFPTGASVVDVGSGAGLPGLVLAILRPDLTLHLVEPMLRRTTWLTETVAGLGLGNVEVHRGRAEEFAGVLSAPWVTARAVARIDKLARWTFPLLEAGGTLVALKGSSAAEELAAEERVLRRLGMVHGEVVTYGEGVLDPPTVTMQLTLGDTRPPQSPNPGGRRRARSR